MGIKLSYGQLNSESLNQALGNLSTQNGFANFQAGYNVARIVRQFQKELKIAREMYGKWTEEFFVKDEKGQLKPATTPHPFAPWEIQEGKQEEFDKKMNEFLAVEVEIQSHPIKPQELGTVKLSPQQILALEPLLDATAFEPIVGEPHKA